jgi:hypothetical protein
MPLKGADAGAYFGGALSCLFGRRHVVNKDLRLLVASGKVNFCPLLIAFEIVITFYQLYAAGH